MARYPHYERTAISWLREAPAHWDFLRAKYIFRRMERAVREQDEVVTAFRDGMVTLRANRRTEGFTFSEKEIGYQGIRRGDLVVHQMDAFAGAIGVSDSDGKSTPVYTVLRPRDSERTHNPYYAYLLRNLASTEFITSLSQGIRQRSTDFRYNVLAELTLPVPAGDEQRTIANFLDRETAKIDALIDRKQRLIELLQEKRTTLITQAVTKGLDPSVEMKDSGVEWLGEIPAHWQALRLRHVIRGIEQGWSPVCDNREASEEEWGVLKAGCVNYGVFDSAEHKALPPEVHPRRGLEVKSGQVLMSRASGSPELIGSVAHVLEPRPQLLLSDKLYRLRYKAEEVDPGYLALVLNSQPTRSQILLSISGAGGLANNLAQSDVKDYWLPLPGLEEQKEIRAFLACVEDNVAQLESSCRKALSRLTEYRTALISAAVTGKIDVREVTA